VDRLASLEGIPNPTHQTGTGSKQWGVGQKDLVAPSVGVEEGEMRAGVRFLNARQMARVPSGHPDRSRSSRSCSQHGVGEPVDFVDARDCGIEDDLGDADVGERPHDLLGLLR